MSESIESIVAEMRERADAMQRHGTTHGVKLTILEFARRIEAAWNKESKAIATENAVLPAVCITKLSGNAAAMRDALRYIVNLIDKNPDRLSAGQLLCIIGDKAEAVLSTPARNCDNYDNKTDAELGFVEETKEDDRNPIYWQIFANWLFSSAERKGEGDA